jgi:hypothetical protein
VLSGGQPERAVRVYNTGGWVIDALEPDPAFGASVVLVSRSLDVVSVRIFNDGNSDGHYRVGVRTAKGSESALLTERVRGAIARRQSEADDPWQELSRALRQEVSLRRRLHHERRRRRD